jgi:hypothetical protein
MTLPDLTPGIYRVELLERAGSSYSATVTAGRSTLLKLD